MKRLSRLSTEEFCFVRLYLDDFYEIIELLKGECESIKIEADDFLIEEPKEVESLNKPVIRELQIKTYNPSLEIDLRPCLAVLRTYGDDTKTAGLSKKLIDILSKLQSPLRFLVNIWCFVGFLVIGLFFIFLAAYLSKQQSHLYGFVCIGFGLALIICSFFMPLLGTRRQFFFILQQKSNKTSFFTRKKDEIFLAIISAVVGSLLTLFTMWLVK